MLDKEVSFLIVFANLILRGFNLKSLANLAAFIDKFDDEKLLKSNPRISDSLVNVTLTTAVVLTNLFRRISSKIIFLNASLLKLNFIFV